MSNERLERLLDAYFDEALDAEQSAELNFHLLSSPQARELFWTRARFHALLRRQGSENWGAWLAESHAAQHSEPRRASLLQRLQHWFADSTWLQPRLLRWEIAAVAALAVIATTLLMRKPEPTQPPLAVIEIKDFKPMVAQLVRAVGVEWLESTNRPGSGMALAAGRLKMRRGLAEVEFYRGARVVIEGPADFEIISDMEARCLYGKIRVEVPPPAHGFKVHAPSLHVIDIGTSFGMDVQTNGQSELHVFKGKIELASAAAPGQLRPLIEGESASVGSSGQVQPLNSSPAVFVPMDEVKQQAQAEMKLRFQKWHGFSQALPKDPSLLLYYDFPGGQPDSQTLLNRAANAEPDSSGTIIGCKWAEGRWPGKGALEFKQYGDRVRFSLPVKLSAFTCVAWARIDGMGHSLNALMMSGASRTGEPQWYLHKSGVLTFGKRILDGWGEDHLENFTTTPAIVPQQMGLWMQLALVYDLPSRTVRQYLNGQEISHRPIKSEISVFFDALEIGNWTPQVGQPVEPLRNFTGRMDEFQIFGRALSAEEIASGYEIGRPL